MKDLMESKAFYNGVAVGLKLQQQKVMEACKNKEPMMIDGELYYVQSGRERLKEVIEKICE